MPPVTNPFPDDPEKAEVFELGYLTGFQDPAGNDSNFLPLTPDLLDIYVQGAEAGREDAHSSPVSDDAMKWVAKSDLDPTAESSSDEAIEHLTVFTIFKIAEELTGKAIFGLFDLIITAVGIQGNVSPEQFRPLDDDFSEDFNGPDPDEVFYVAACPRKDHPQVEVGVSPDGFWSGTASHDFKDALREAMHHEHRESLIARCDTGAQTCSVVWLAEPTQ